MTKMAKAVLPKEWRAFANRYGSNRAYWYVPKGLAVSTESIMPRLKVLQEFEGQRWRDCQQAFVQRLNDEGISHAEADWGDGGAPLARMLKQVLVMLGLAWVDGDDLVEITAAGSRFLTSKDPDGVLSDQLGRYQFTNPSVNSAAHEAIAVHPVPFLGELLRSLEGHSFDAAEYNLFVSRAKSFDDVDEVVDLIDRYRSMAEEQRGLLIETCKAFKIGGIRRSSMYNTIKLNRTYALRMYALSRMFVMNDEGGLSLQKGAGKVFRAYLANYAAHGDYIEFANEKDWISYFGDPDAEPTTDTALDYYVNKGDVAAAIATKKKTAKSKGELTAFQDMIVSEKALEDYLENHLDVIGDVVKRKLTLVKRQYSTTVGPIDLLAKDAKTGDWVVIELKKGRSADKVYGQCSRYMGWVKKNLAKTGQKVHGVIIGKTIDEKLRSARDAHDTKVDLVEFEMKVGASTV